MLVQQPMYFSLSVALLRLHLEQIPFPCYIIIYNGMSSLGVFNERKKEHCEWRGLTEVVRINKASNEVPKECLEEGSDYM